MPPYVAVLVTGQASGSQNRTFTAKFLGGNVASMVAKFPNNLKQAMNEAGIGPTKLADAVGSTKQDIYRIAKGERKFPPELADRIGKFLGRSANSLLLIDEPENYLHPALVDNLTDGGKPAPDVIEMAIASARSNINPTADRTSVPLNGIVSAGGAIDSSTEQNEAGSEHEALIMATIPDAKSAYHVVGMSMFPSYKPDTLIVCGARVTDVDALIGEEAVVEDVDGGRYLKIIRAGEEADTFDLESYNAPTMPNVKLRWAAEIVAIIPARKWLRLAKRARQSGR